MLVKDSDMCKCLEQQKKARIISRKFDDLLRPFGLTNGQFSIIMVIHENKTTTISNLSKKLDIDRSTLSTNIRRLETKNILNITKNSSDSRLKTISLNESGNYLFRQCRNVWCDFMNDINTNSS